MKIEMWSDIICPVCGLTQYRLAEALRRFEHRDEVELIHRSFQLHPGLPRDGVPQLELFHAVGKDERDMRRILRPLEEAAEAEGFGPYHAIDRTLGPTDHAHELLAFASDKGLNAEAWSTMFRAHFGEARKLWTIDEVVDFAAEIGLDAAEARRALESRSYRSRVEEEQRNAQRLGAAGTPFIVIDDTYGIAGGRDTAALLAALRQVWDESHPAPAIISFDDVEGDSCGPDGCTVSGASAESPAGP